MAKPYITPAMTRIFLTLLALLTGFAAQVSPAQARVSADVVAEIGAIQRAEIGTRAAVQVVQTLGFAANRAVPERQSASAKLPQLLVYHPTVRLGSDRSLD